MNRVQAYGIFHHDDACLTDWTNSWQKWAEPITGGWVCTRAIPSLGETNSAFGT